MSGGQVPCAACQAGVHCFDAARCPCCSRERDGAALGAWYEDIRRAEGRLRLQLVTDLASKINEGKFDGETGTPAEEGRRREDR